MEALTQETDFLRQMYEEVWGHKAAKAPRNMAVRHWKVLANIWLLKLLVWGHRAELRDPRQVYCQKVKGIASCLICQADKLVLPVSVVTIITNLKL